MKKTALIMVDLQNDFCPGGSLAVQEGDAVIPIANELQSRFDLVIATKDWHPQNHMSFASNHGHHKVGDTIKVNGFNQVLWPDHCVQDSKGAEFHPLLNTDRIQHIFYKGTNPLVDSYSAFYDNQHLRSTGLDDFLKKEQVTDIYIMGLATDYCVKYSCLDAAQMRLNVYMIEDACRGVELRVGDIANALEGIKNAGVKVIKLKEVMKLKKKT